MLSSVVVKPARAFIDPLTASLGFAACGLSVALWAAYKNEKAFAESVKKSQNGFGKITMDFGKMKVVPSHNKQIYVQGTGPKIDELIKNLKKQGFTVIRR